MKTETFLSGHFKDIISACTEIASLPEAQQDNTVFLIHGLDHEGYRTKGYRITNPEDIDMERAKQSVQTLIETECLYSPAGFCVTLNGRREFGSNLHHGVSDVITQRMKMLLGKKGKR